MILLIDNDVATSGSLERMLRYMGHDAMSVHDAMEALNLLTARRPQLILLDIALQGPVSGALLLKSIRQDPTFDNVPIWIFSADFSPESHLRATAAGAQNYIVKGTIGHASIVQRIDALLNPKT